MSSAAAAGSAPPPGLIEVELPVRGMTCAACAARVQKKLAAIDGVAASVNFATGKATIMAPPSVSVARLLEAGGQAGYGAAAVRRRAGAERSCGGIYLEVAASVSAFLLAGRWYEARARRNAADAMRELAAAGASEACVLAGDGTERRVPVSRLRPGDRFVVRPGETIAADGVVEIGESVVDTAMMTRGTVPADVVEGGAVTPGTVVVAGRLVVRASRTGDDTQLAQLIALVDRAQAGKSAVQRLADPLCVLFVPTAPAAPRLTH